MILNLPIETVITTGAATVFVGLCAAFHKKITNGLVWVFHRTVTRIKKDYAYHINCPGAEMMKMVADIQAQLRTNGGSTMLDAVHRIERGQKVLTREMKFMRIAQDLFTESINFPAFHTNHLGMTTWINKVLKLLAGITADEDAMGLGWLSMVHPDDRERVRRVWLEAIADKRDYSDEYRIISATTGKTMLISSVAKVIRTDDGIVGWSGTFKIVGGRREADGTELHPVAEHAGVT